MHHSTWAVGHQVPGYSERAESVSGSHPWRGSFWKWHGFPPNQGKYRKMMKNDWFLGESKHIKFHQPGHIAQVVMKRSSNFDQHLIYVSKNAWWPWNLKVTHSGSHNFQSCYTYRSYSRTLINSMSNSNSYLFAPYLCPNWTMFVLRVMGLWPVALWLIHHVVGSLRLVHLIRIKKW